MKKKEDCSWCMSTQHIERKISGHMPEEYRHRCSACHEEWASTHDECDKCGCCIVLDDSNWEFDTDYDWTIAPRVCFKCIKKS